MKHVGDHDGKSKSASAVDGTHYPHPAESSVDEETEPPSHADIAARAHQMWLEQGQPEGSADQNWLEAERELKTAAGSRSLVHQVHQHAGSVQS